MSINQIQEAKEKYGQRAESIIAGGLNLVAKGKKYRCPNTMAHRRGDMVASMSWDNKALQFFCFACGMKIDIYGYYKEHLNYEHNEIIFELLGEQGNNRFEKERKSFKDNLNKVKTVNEKCIEYILKREK